METIKNKTVRNITLFGVVASLLFFATPVGAQDDFQDPPPDVVSQPIAPSAEAPTENPVASEIPAHAPAEEPEAAEIVETQELEEELPVSRLLGEMPTRFRKVTVDATDDTISDILLSVSKQAGFGLVMSPSQTSLQKKMTIQLKRKPFNEVLEIVLESGNLQGTLKGGILFVTASTIPQSGEEDPDEEVLIEAGTDSEGAFIHVKTNKSGKHGSQGRVQIGKSIHIRADEVVDEAVAVGGSLTIEGEVRGDAVAIGGNLNIEPTAHVHGDAVSVGGSLNIKPGAKVDGEQVGVGIPIPIGALFDEDGNINMILPIAVSGFAGTFAAFTLLRVLLQSILLFVFALGITALAPKRVERIRNYLSEKTGYSVLAGLVIFIAFIPFLVLLAFTLIGIPLIPVAIIILLVMIAFGQAALLTWVGYKIPLFKTKKNQLGAMAIGAVAILLISLVPVAGPLFLFVTGLISAGAALLSRLGSSKHAA